MSAEPDILSHLFGLQNKRVIVTGGGAGMGAGICQLFARVGAHVAVIDLDSAAACETAGAITSSGGIAFPIGLDLADETSVKSGLAAAVAALGGVDILVNNAAIYPRNALLTMTAAQWDSIHAVNSRGAMFCIREIAAAMIKAGQGGRIINISSVGSIRNTVHDHAAYASSKASLNSLTLVAALELAEHNILVNAVLPGMTRSATAQRSLASLTRPPHGPMLQPSRLPLGRMAEVEEVIGPVLFLAAQASSYMTGQLLVVDGGFTVS